tara:strand:- start:7868 stop:8068 length:201 start_codon:yes stop_codon:yes gene_type:complete
MMNKEYKSFNTTILHHGAGLLKRVVTFPIKGTYIPTIKKEEHNDPKKEQASYLPGWESARHFTYNG